MELPMQIAVSDLTQAGGSGLIVTVVEQVEVLPQASVAVQVTVVVPRLYVLLGVAPDPLPVVAPDFTQLNVIVPVQLSVAVAGGIVYVLLVTWQNICAGGQVIVGGVKSSVHVTVRDLVEVFPHASVAVKVLVCERRQPLLCTAPSFCVMVTAPQASVAVAPFNAASIFVGLQPRLTVA
jgi:hypothetical protein